MKDIKFRAWDKATSSMITSNDDANGDVKIYLNGAVSIDDVWATKEVELMQYTGLKDKNGVEIYEGDILSIDWVYQDSNKPYTDDSIGMKYMVEWVGGRYICRLINGGLTFDIGEINQATFERFWREDYRGCKNEYFKMTNIEVIGNIYQNPELLEGE